jgi:hypothetical protein
MTLGASVDSSRAGRTASRSSSTLKAARRSNSKVLLLPVRNIVHAHSCHGLNIDRTLDGSRGARRSTSFGARVALVLEHGAEVLNLTHGC